MNLCAEHNPADLHPVYPGRGYTVWLACDKCAYWEPAPPNDDVTVTLLRRRRQRDLRNWTGDMTLPVYRHADGGHYVIVDDQNHQMKMDDGRWEPAILYRGVEPKPDGGFMYRDKHTFSTTRSRWADRFVAVGETR